MVKIKNAKKYKFIPMKPFKTYEEEANFWDTHSVIDEINEGTLVGFHKANKTDTLTIRFQPEYIQILKEEALQLGLGPTTLVRMWVMEKLGFHSQHKRSSKASSPQAVLHRIKAAK